MKDVFFYEMNDREFENLKGLLPTSIKVGYTNHSIQESGHEEPPSKLISVRTFSDIPTRWSTEIAGIFSRTTGFDKLTRYRKDTGKKDMPMGYLPVFANRSCAEHALMMLMYLLKDGRGQVNRYNNLSHTDIRARDLSGLTAVVFGVGKIGYEVYKLFKGVGIEVYGVDIIKQHFDVDYITIDDAEKKADIAVCCMNLTEKNKNYFSYEFFKLMKKGLFFINLARGEHSPSSGILKALEEGLLGGVCLDVFDCESEIFNSDVTGTVPESEAAEALMEIARMRNVVVTPHSAFNTKEAMQRKAEQTAEQVNEFLYCDKFIWNIPDEH